MKNIFFNKTLWAFALVALTLSSCDDTLTVDPRQSVDSDVALSSREGVNAAVNSVYAHLRAQDLYGRDLIALPDALADNGVTTGNSGRLINENRNIPYAHFLNWRESYIAINEANLILDAIPNINASPAVTEAEVNKWIGQLKFLRALMYFNLVRAYAYDPGVVVAERDKGGVPLSIVGIKDAAEASSNLPARASVSAVYDQIYSDLEDAVAKLADGGSTFYANKGAAQALLSRVALYRKDYAKAASSATDAIASSKGIIASGSAYVNGWRAASNPESMFEVAFNVAAENLGVNVALQSTFTSILNLATPLASGGGWGDLVPTTDLRSLIGISQSGNTIVRGTDIRGQLYEVGNGRGSGAKIECIKFLGKTGTIYMDHVPVIRKPEALLNRAEAYATPGSSVFNEAKALADLNTLRTARGLTEVDLGGADLYNEILLQRRLELAFEGHRWFDLKRLGKDIVKSPATVEYTDFRILANIPQREVDGNSNLVQNDGY